MPGSSKQKKTELKVIFDSNVLYTVTASDLINHSVGKLINESSCHYDINLSWYLPEIVVLERKYQMIQKGIELLPSIQKLEQLLGHNLNITPEIIKERVNLAVQKQLAQYNIKVESLAIEKVNWKILINKSVFREPPFEPGEKEKGFRDAVIAETFLQIVNDSPSTPKICRIALVTNDSLLIKSITERTTNKTNIRIVRSIDELKSLINTLVSTVSEEVVAKIKEHAASYFFIPEQKNTLFYSKNILQTIQEKFKKELEDIPESADFRENGTWSIFYPSFLKKEKQRVTWVSPIEVEAKAFKHEQQYTTFAGVITQPDSQPPSLFKSTVNNLLATTKNQSALYDFATNLRQAREKIISYEPKPAKLVAEGKTSFEVTWSHILGTNQRLSSPRIEHIDTLRSAWEIK